MKECPILFSTPMVLALLEGRKTQTRQIVNKLNKLGKTQEINYRKSLNSFEIITKKHKHHLHSNEFLELCPYGFLGDGLWVKETYSETHRADGTPVILYKTGENIPIGIKDGNQFLIKDFRSTEDVYVDKWKSSIYMPRWASRINLEITGVRVERLRDISEKDDKPEGIENIGKIIDCWKDYQADHDYRDENFLQKAGIAFNQPILSYRSLLESINGLNSWKVNPWVWVIEFKLVDKAC